MSGVTIDLVALTRGFIGLGLEIGFTFYCLMVGWTGVVLIVTAWRALFRR